MRIPPVGLAVCFWSIQQGTASHPLGKTRIHGSFPTRWKSVRGGSIMVIDPPNSAADTDDGESSTPTTAATSNAAKQGSTRAFVNTKGNLDTLKRHLDAMHPIQIHLNAKKSVEHLKAQSQLLMQSAGPTMLSLLSPNEQGLLSARQIYALALLGSSCGFYLFLYFITVGYALGITLPIAVALVLGHAHHSIPFWTNVQSTLIVVWGIRSACYFMYREYVNWPQLHDKVVQVDAMARRSSKVFCWLAYPLFYMTMTTPCLARLEQAAKMVGSTETSKQWGVVGKFGIFLSMVGLALETIADQQKSAFKSSSTKNNRNEWCHVGLWKFSTHPNYLGENMVWLGTFVSGMGALRTKIQWLSSLVGLLFITFVLSGARSSLSSKHWRKYGTNEDFVEFRRTHWILGPIPGTKPNEKRVSVL